MEEREAIVEEKLERSSLRKEASARELEPVIVKSVIVTSEEGVNCDILTDAQVASLQQELGRVLAIVESLQQNE